jgi:predicted naringenin-chalcone synthase
MTLAKDVPVRIGRALEEYLKRLSLLAKKDWAAILEQGFFAIHPGGPKILQQIQELFKLNDKQLYHSREVLREYGNMSSATLPHIWEKMLNDPVVPNGALVVSLAFGPGLTISGGLFEKGGCS